MRNVGFWRNLTVINLTVRNLPVKNLILIRRHFPHVLLIFLILGGYVGFDLISRLGAELLWFNEVGYQQVLLKQLITRGFLWVMVFAIAVTYGLGNLYLANRWQYPLDTNSKSRNSSILPRYSLAFPTRQTTHQPTPISFIWLLLCTSGLSLLTVFLLWHYGQIALDYWLNGTYSANAINHIPSRFHPDLIWQLAQSMINQGWFLIPILGLSALVLRYSRVLLNAIAIVFAVILAQITIPHWGNFLQFFHPTLFRNKDAVFQHDISFYIFALPVWQLSELIFGGLFLYTFLSVSLTYLLSANSLSEGKFVGFSWQQKRHLCATGGALMFVVSLSFWLSRYELLYSPRGVVFGASYTDIHAQLPTYTTLAIIALFLALYLLGRSLFWPSQPRSSRRVLAIISLAIFLMGIIGEVIPSLVQYLIVQPNEFVREKPYIERTIAMTRQAFNLDHINAQTFNPQVNLTQADLRNNDLTIRNIRLWDERPLLETNRQLQQIRPYYRFPGADIDRYRFSNNQTNNNQPNNQNTRQVLIAARELDYQAIPQPAQTWLNRHLLYTHGYGFTLSPVNTVAPGGLPEYFVKDIGAVDGETLNVSSPEARANIPIENPRIYYGEITNNYVMTGTKQRELDYPSGSDNVYNNYDGTGGIPVNSWWRRFMFAQYLKDWRMAITTQFKPETKILFRRNINQRIRAIAPFLRYDSDPYLVVADIGTPHHLFWVVDAYTSSSYYPYSDIGSQGINYIRNSVKVIIDAYNGSVKFYIADTTDPIIRTWSAIFPQLFLSSAQMPTNLKTHLRYPIDYFKIQAERLMVYHMTDPQVFYNREDEWQIPNEVYGDQPSVVEPYYLITSLPQVEFEEFILLLPYTPRQRTNLIAWFAARSDGENYGKLLLYNFPKQRLIYGPEQIEARINQDPVISQQISLWNRQGSKAVQGNLLIVPIEESLLYVEPLYLQATQNSLPTLVRVIVAYENKIVMAPSLEQALTGIFQNQQTPAPPIIRPVEVSP